MTEKEKMLAGALYTASDPELTKDAMAAAAWMRRFNACDDPKVQTALLHAQLAAVGEGVRIRPPFHCDYGYNIRLGRGVFLNFNCVILDVVEVMIGDLTQIGPGVQILTADHPRDRATRARMLEFGRPVRIGANVWIGGGALLMPGVTVGDDAVIGAGAVVTRDVAPGTTVAGNPARVLAHRTGG